MFPKDSAFKQTQDAMDQGAGVVRYPPLRTPEDNQRIAAARNRAIVSVPAHIFEGWATTLEEVGHAHYHRTGSVQADLEDVVNEIRSYLP